MNTNVSIIKFTKEDKKQDAIKAIKFTLFAASAGLIEYGSFSILVLLPELSAKSNYWIPALISLILSVIWNFTFNRKSPFVAQITSLLR